MKQYQELLQEILCTGFERSDRTGTGTIGVFGTQKKYDLKEGFPLLTTKKMFLKGIIHELLFFLRGETNNNSLEEVGVSIWREWAKPDGDLGRIYGAQWIDWIGIDPKTGEKVHVNQVANLIDRLKTNPDCRRLIITAWNPAEVHSVGLAWCHVLSQFNTHLLTEKQRQEILLSEISDAQERKDFIMSYDGEASMTHEDLDEAGIPRRQIDLHLTQRSADTFLGVPFNIASYALLLMMVAQVTKMQPGVFVHTCCDTHLYKNHLDQAKLQLSRIPKKLPTMKIKDRGQDIFGFQYDDFELQNYDCHPAIKGEVSI